MARRQSPAQLANLTGGSRKGIPNKRTREIGEFARKLLEDPEYVKKARARLIAGKAPHLEPMLYAYGYGKPKERVEVSGPDGGPVVFQGMTDAELAARAAALAAKLGGEK